MRLPKITRGSYKQNPITNVDVKQELLGKVSYQPDVDMEDDKSVAKYVKAIKAVVRASGEYGTLMSFIKYHLDMNSCFYLPNVKQYRGNKISIEQHHMGGTISEIIETVLRKRFKEGEPYNVSDVAEEVMLLHYRGAISLVPLSTTVHELIHADDSQLFIPIQHAKFGDTRIFFDEYKEYMKKEMRAKFEKYFLLSEAFDNIEEIIPSYLNIKVIYYNCEGIEVPRMDKLIEILDEVA